MRHWLALSLPLSLPVVFPSLASAQDFSSRFLDHTEPRAQRGKYFRLAQVDSPSSPRAVEAPGPATAPSPELPEGARVPRVGGRKPITINVDTRFGFDDAKVFVPATIPFEVSVKRRIRTIVVSGSYPITPRTQLSLNIPYINQSTKNSAGGQTFRQRGDGIGDISIWLNHAIPRMKQRVELGLAGGLIIPTGRNPFDLGPTELETGLGLFQPAVRVSARTLSVPMQFFGSLDYSPRVSRRIEGAKRTLPAQYGGEAGFFYTLGPSWATQTSVSLGKSSSPVLQAPGSTVGYLTQAINYRSGNRTSFRGALDVGLTDESVDAYFGLSLNSSF